MRKTVAIMGTRGYPSYYGGFETAVRHLAPYLSDHNWTVRVYSRPGRVHHDGQDVDERVEVVYTWGIDGKALSTLSFGFTSTLHALWRKPDVALVMNCANGFWIPLLRLRGIATLTNVDGIEWQRAKWGRFARATFLLGARMTAKWSTDLVFDARSIERYWQKRFGRDGRYIPYGGEPCPPLSLKDNLPSGKYVLLVARFVTENTVAEFMEAAPTIAKYAPVVLVGSSGHGGPLDEKAQELSAKYKNIHWLGHINDDDRLFALWQNAGVYFHGHTVGGTNPALVQAMALGANIVAVDTIYNREVLADTGHYCRPTPESILLTVSDSLDPDGNLGPRASARARMMYAWDGVLDAYETALNTISSTNPRFPRQRANRTNV